ncbi:hypothetical protein EMPG_17711 [Blastomyces silverae]|uniref:Uncharacterized protein n=1 Tax=Blastomyces silverae TaxID=2060906 RepID=A0A0H1B6Y5_9EURO|nr:hypothetical protein EMPG_17711 [Blastomyces silverae]
MGFLDPLRRRKAEKGQLSHDASSPESTISAEHSRGRSAVIRHRALYSLIYLIAFIFIILVLVGSTSDKAAIRQTYFIKIDLSNVVPRSVPDAALINSIARTIGLHDFYQVGLWNFCEGYKDGSGITFCSRPKQLYYFNPVEILLSELLAGATIALPGEIDQALRIVRIASRWMFGFFVASTVLIFLCIFLTPLSVPSTLTPHTSKHRAVSKRVFIPLVIVTFLTFFTTLAASVIATAMFTIFKIVFASKAAEFNIEAELGTRMLVFMWLAVGFVLLGFFLHIRSILAWCCCCCCRRGRPRGKRNVGNAVGMAEPDGDVGEKHRPSKWGRARMDA